MFGGNGEMRTNGEKREKLGIEDGDGYRSPPKFLIPIFPKWENGEGWGKGMESGDGDGGTYIHPHSPNVHLYMGCKKICHKIYSSIKTYIIYVNMS